MSNLNLSQQDDLEACHALDNFLKRYPERQEEVMNLFKANPKYTVVSPIIDMNEFEARTSRIKEVNDQPGYAPLTNLQVAILMIMPLHQLQEQGLAQLLANARQFGLFIAYCKWSHRIPSNVGLTWCSSEGFPTRGRGRAARFDGEKEASRQ